jgi:hypothetical protein
MSQRTARRVGGHPRRTRRVRRSSAGLTPVRAGAGLAMLVSAGAIYGLAATSAFGFARLQIDGATITSNAVVGQRLGLAPGTNIFQIATEPLESRLREIPAVAGAEISIGLPDTVAVTIQERKPLLVWQTTLSRLLVDSTGLLFGEVGEAPPASIAGLPVILDTRLASGSFAITSSVDPVDLDVATRLASLTPAGVGSAASGLAVSVTDENGFVLRSVPESWAAIFGFYGRSLRTPELVAGQVQLLASLLAKAGEANVETVILADDRDGTFIPKPTPKPSASTAP